jgi:hypothetical protein
MQKRWLYLDDARPVPNEDWTLARTYQECVDRLKAEAGSIGYLSLDHDIGACDACVAAGKHIGDMLTPETTFFNCCPHAKTGYDVVKWLGEQLFMYGNDYWPLNKPMCHSANPAGRNNIIGYVSRYWPVVLDIRESRRKDGQSLRNEPTSEPNR